MRRNIDGIGGWTDGALTLTGAGDATRVTVTNVTRELFKHSSRAANPRSIVSSSRRRGWQLAIRHPLGPDLGATVWRA